MERVQGSRNFSHVKQHSLKPKGISQRSNVPRARHCFRLFFGWTDLTPPFALLPLLSHPLSRHIHLSFTHLSLLLQLYSFSHFISTLFPFLRFARPLKFSQFSLLASLPPSGMSFHLSRIFYSLLIYHCIFPPQRILHTFFLFFITDASLSGRVCRKNLKHHLPFLLRPTCPSSSMWRSRTLEPQFWAPLMSSACWDTTAMYPSWSKVG